MSLFRKKEEILGNVVKFSRSTAKHSPEMILDRIEKLQKETKEELESLCYDEESVAMCEMSMDVCQEVFRRSAHPILSYYSEIGRLNSCVWKKETSVYFNLHKMKEIVERYEEKHKDELSSNALRVEALKMKLYFLEKDYVLVRKIAGRKL
jgi:hypothetical protein